MHEDSQPSFEELQLAELRAIREGLKRVNLSLGDVPTSRFFRAPVGTIAAGVFFGVFFTIIMLLLIGCLWGLAGWPYRPPQ